MNNENEDAEEDSDDRSTTSSSHRSANNNLTSKSPDPMSCLMLDKVRKFVKNDISGYKL